MGRMRIGCPVWGHRDWKGVVFPIDAPVDSFLHHYAQCFGAVEGNTTFYGIPSEATIAKWCAQVHDDFRFCLKFPSEVSHRGHLSSRLALAQHFIERTDPLAHRLGPTFLQLHKNYSASSFVDFATFIGHLPKHRPFAVEVRHPGFFSGDNHRRLLDLLTEHRVDRVIFDTRVLFRSRSESEATRRAQQKKPRTPIRQEATGSYPMLRLAGADVWDEFEPCIKAWAPVLVQWMVEGREPSLFIHTPTNAQSPRWCEQSWCIIQEAAARRDITLADWSLPPAMRRLDVLTKQAALPF